MKATYKTIIPKFLYTTMFLFTFSSCSIQGDYTYFDGIYENPQHSPNKVFTEEMYKANALHEMDINSAPVNLNDTIKKYKQTTTPQYTVNNYYNYQPNRNYYWDYNISYINPYMYNNFWIYGQPFISYGNFYYGSSYYYRPYWFYNTPRYHQSYRPSNYRDQWYYSRNSYNPYENNRSNGRQHNYSSNSRNYNYHPNHNSNNGVIERNYNYSNNNNNNNNNNNSSNIYNRSTPNYDNARSYKPSSSSNHRVR